MVEEVTLNGMLSSIAEDLTSVILDMLITIIPIIAPYLGIVIAITVFLHVIGRFTGEEAVRDVFMEHMEPLYDDEFWDDLNNEEVDWSNWEEHFSE